jgi:RHS repeat-associated protein
MGSTTDANSQSYNPDNHLIMAYVPPNCMQYHTAGQGARMRTIIANSSLLRNVAETYSSISISDRIYPTAIENLFGRRTFNINANHVEFTNTTVNSNATVNVHAESIILHPNFWAKSGSTVSIKAVQASSSSLLSTQVVEVENDTDRLTSLEQAVVLQKTVYYLGNYEKEIASGGSTKEYDYICTPEGLSAIAVKTNGTRSLYYVQTDHLGSIRVVTTASKGIRTRYYYDAWGKQTLMSGSRITNRGYIGEEHLNDFGLINLNARLYDPVLARFMGVDPYVQAADFTQAYNRYAYCYNNPMKFTDPSGEIVWFIPVIIGIVAGAANVAANWDNIDGFWQGVAAFGVGAGAGVAACFTGGQSFWVVAGVAAGGGALTGATNNVIAQTGHNFAGFNNVDWGQVGISSAIGGAAGFAGGSAGYWASNASFLVNGVSSPIARSAIVSPLAAGAGHIAGGTTANLIAGQNLGDAFANSFQGIEKSMAIGGAIGVATTTATSLASGVNPLNGKNMYPSNNGFKGQPTST